MPLTDDDRQRVRARFLRVHEEYGGADGEARQRLVREALHDATSHLTAAELAQLVGEVDAARERKRLRADRLGHALDAIMAAVVAEGVSTPAELMARRDIQTLPALLLSLGLIDDLAELAADIGDDGPASPPRR